MNRLNPIITAIVQCHIEVNITGNESNNESMIQETTQDLTQKIELMPKQLIMPLSILTVLFNWCSVLKTGKTFCRCSHGQRMKQINQWQKSSLSFKRDFIHFYEKIVLFIYYSNLQKTAPCE